MDVLSSLDGWIAPFLSGVGQTILVTALGAALALAVAFGLGLLAGMRPRTPRFAARVVIEFFRGTSLLVQLYWLFFVLPLLGYKLDPLAVGVLALGLNFGAYGAEVVRGAISAVPTAQWEGAIALNFPPFARMRRIILPQAIVAMIPPFNNLLIQLLKSTPLVFTVTIVDVFAVVQNYRNSPEGHTGFAFGVALVVYFVLAYLLTLLMNLLEARAASRLGRGAPRRQLFSLRTPVESEVR